VADELALAMLAQALTEGPITMLDSTFTTHDSQNPNYHVKVKKLEVYPDDKIVMHGAKFYLGNTPILWFPYFVQPMDEELGYYFTPGWNSAWGGFLLNRYGFMIGENHHAQAHFDIRSERGLAGGIEFFDRKFKNNENLGRLNLYYANDTNPQLSFNGRNRRGDTIPPTERYRINFQHRVYIPGTDDETFYLDFDINRLSDAYLYEDFFPSEFRIDPKPDNVINLNKLFDQGEISLTGRFQLNEFCMSLRTQENRDRFHADERTYLDEWDMSEDQKQAVLTRDFQKMLDNGGNVYFLSKIFAAEGMSYVQAVSTMTDMNVEEYQAMMVAGGRNIEGWRSKTERGEA
jgi:protocatechuate 4,5-dioxygenase alpha subunit